MDGEIKVVALWRYKKFPANGAPFVYQCSELISSAGPEEAEVCDYCVSILKAQGLKVTSRVCALTLNLTRNVCVLSGDLLIRRSSTAVEMDPR